MPPSWAAAVQQLWTSVTGGDTLLHVRPLTGPRGFEVCAENGAVHVAATDAPAACAGIHRYLREAHGLRVTWDTELPLEIGEPAPVAPIHGRARADRFYYLNFCTFSYSTAYWDWDEWAREIDWMALHGVTMPLSLVGHEAVLAMVYSRLGMSDVDIRSFLGGPGYLPFVYMGCMDSFAGPLPVDWIPRRLELGRRILERQRALGMTPVLPAFTGHVPRQLAPPGARTRFWQGMETTVVGPDDPLFRRLTAEIVTAQRELFGTDHLYASDPFIEMIPAGDDHPAAVAAAVVDGLRAADDEAVWVLQSWPFSYQREYWTTERVHRFLDGIPDGRVLVLDLWGEADPQWQRLDGYGGRPWLWNGLLNFGGRSEPVADLAATGRNLEAALAAGRPPAGLGLTMEAIHNNPAFFELITDRAWRDEPAEAWLREFGGQRYGTADPAAGEAWLRLGASVLDGTSQAIFPERFISVTVSTPDYSRLLDTGTTIHDDVRAALFYQPRDVLAAMRALLRVPVSAAASDDLALSGIALLLRVIDHRFSASLTTAVHNGQMDADFLDVFDDLDDLAATRPNMRLSTWVAAARRCSDDDQGRQVLQDNARRIVTVWNTPENPQLDNYSARIWSGLVAGYHKRRWQLWLRFLPQALAPGGRAAAQSLLDTELRRLAETFIASGVPDDRAGGDVREVAQRVLARYGDEFLTLKGVRHAGN
jgi:alpha-N-acetylglucosaminidase